MVLPEEIQNAAFNCNFTALRAWLESGGDPNDTDGRGRTPLIILVDGGMVSDDHLDVARLLLSHGADVTVTHRARPRTRESADALEDAA